MTTSDELRQHLSDIASCRSQGICWKCRMRVHNPATGEWDETRVPTRLGKQEFFISGTCETCFDAMFQEDEPED